MNQTQTVTPKEAALLNDIITSEYQHGDVVGHDIWFDSIVDSTSKGGVYASLLAKGFVGSYVTKEKVDGLQITESTISITQAGFDAVSAVTVTDSDIKTLRREALAAGDVAQAAICTIALHPYWTSETARIECARVIRAAADAL